MVSMSVKKSSPEFNKLDCLLTINPQGFNFFHHKDIQKNDKQNKNLFNYFTA